MKIFTYILITIAALLAIYNITKLDFNNPFEGDSSIAAIGILAAACVVLLLLILGTSKKIQKKKK